MSPKPKQRWSVSLGPEHLRDLLRYGIVKVGPVTVFLGSTTNEQAQTLRICREVLDEFTEEERVT